MEKLVSESQHISNAYKQRIISNTYQHIDMQFHLLQSALPPRHKMVDCKYATGAQETIPASARGCKPQVPTVSAPPAEKIAKWP